MPTIIKSFFTIHGEIDPDQLTNSIGITPDRIWKKGELVSKTILTRKESAWRLSTYHEGQGSCDCYTKELLSRIEKKYDFIKKLLEIDTIEGTISHIIYVHENEVPIIDVKVDTMKILSDLNIDIDIDLYCVGE